MAGTYGVAPPWLLSLLPEFKLLPKPVLYILEVRLSISLFVVAEIIVLAGTENEEEPVRKAELLALFVRVGIAVAAEEPKFKLWFCEMGVNGLVEIAEELLAVKKEEGETTE